MPGLVEGHVTISPLAGSPATKGMLIDAVRLGREYYERQPDLDNPHQLVEFGANGHRGSPLHNSFTEAHILAITQAICDFRRTPRGRMARCTWARTRTRCPGRRSARRCEVLAANGVEAVIQHERWRDSRAGHLARHPVIQPGAEERLRRRHSGHAVAQSARGRRLQVQPAEWRPRRYAT